MSSRFLNTQGLPPCLTAPFSVLKAGNDTVPVTMVSLGKKAQVSLVQKAVKKEDTDHLNVFFGTSLVAICMMSWAIFSN